MNALGMMNCKLRNPFHPRQAMIVCFAYHCWVVIGTTGISLTLSDGDLLQQKNVLCDLLWHVCVQVLPYSLSFFVTCHTTSMAICLCACVSCSPWQFWWPAMNLNGNFHVLHVNLYYLMWKLCAQWQHSAQHVYMSISELRHKEIEGMLMFVACGAGARVRKHAHIWTTWQHKNTS